MRLRESVRALILDPDDCVLLVRFDWDGLDVEGGFWANPGGGVEPGETRLPGDAHVDGGSIDFVA